MQGKRSLKGLFIHPSSQIKFCAATLLILLVVTGVIGTVTCYVLDDVFDLLAEHCSSSDVIKTAVEMSYVYLIKTMVIALAIMFVIATFAMLILTHRYAGASFALNRHIQNNLVKGIYDKPIKLRKSDFLTEIADSLNQLSEKLKSK